MTVMVARVGRIGQAARACGVPWAPSKCSATRHGSGRAAMVVLFGGGASKRALLRTIAMLSFALGAARAADQPPPQPEHPEALLARAAFCFGALDQMVQTLTQSIATSCPLRKPQKPGAVNPCPSTNSDLKLYETRKEC